MDTYTNESSWRTLDEALERFPQGAESSRVHRAVSSQAASTLWALCVVCGDLIAVLLAWAAIVICVDHRYLSTNKGIQLALPALLLALCTVSILWLFDAYHIGEIRRPEQELECIVKAFAGVFVLLCARRITGSVITFNSWSAAALWSAFALILVLAWRWVVHSILSAAWNLGRRRRTIIFIGSRRGVKDFTQHLAIQRFAGIEILGAICTEIDSHAFEELHDGPAPIGRLEDWSALAARLCPEAVVLDLDGLFPDSDLVPEIVSACRQMGIAVEIYSSAIDAKAEHEADRYLGCLRVRHKPHWSKQAEKLSKVLLDRTIGLIGSLATLVLVPILWIVMKFEDGGPVFYRQEYVGSDLQIHYYLKFRTMIQNADTVLKADPELKRRFAEKHKLIDDPRILRCGRILRKLSIDEFPEFFSVLTGKLSFVGPRTISAVEKTRYGPLLGKLLSVKPALTGYWQIMGRQTTTYEERVQMDMFYIDHWSIWLDLVIIGKTFIKFFAQEGAY